MFYIGQEVVCIDDKHTNSDNYQELDCNTVYIIRWVGALPESMTHIPRRYHGSRYGVRLIGVPRELHGDCPFSADRFRPLIKQKKETGMEILLKLQGKQDQKNKKLEDA